MRRSICYCEPNSATAGETNTWRFIYSSATSLPKGTKIKFDLQSMGRNIDWEIPSTNLKKAANVIYAMLENGKSLQLKEILPQDSVAPQFEFALPAKLEAGGSVTIVVGAPPEAKKSDKDNGTRSQCNAQRRRTFHLFIDPSGKGHYSEPEVFSLDVRGSTLSTIRVLTPSFAIRNKRFDVIVRFEDEFGNLTSNALENTLVELSHENLRENLNWKLFVPETGFITVPNLYFNELGIYTIRLVNTTTKETFKSPPIKCFAENNKNLFWGVLHGESERIDSTENIESCLRHFRDEKATNFYTGSPFEEETSTEMWKLISQNIAEFDETDRFCTFLGFQWVGLRHHEGIRQIIFAKDSKSLPHKKDPKYTSLKKLYKSFSPKEIISIPCFTMAKGLEYDFKDFNPDFERVIEIYNSWGSSECLKKEGNPLSIEGQNKNDIQESAEGSVTKALLANHRFGFVAGGLDDRGVYAELFESGQQQYPPGLTAIISPEHSRSSLFEALYNRSCYATTGERMVIGLSLAGVPMGGETSTAQKQGLLVNRHLSGYAAGTAKIEKVELIRNGKVIKTFHSDTYYLDITYDDMIPLDKVAIDAKDKKPPFAFYYLRVTQEDGHMAWSSPIWVDLVPVVSIKRNQAKPSAKSPAHSLKANDADEEDKSDFDEEEDDFSDFDDEE